MSYYTGATSTFVRGGGEIFILRGWVLGRVGGASPLCRKNFRKESTVFRVWSKKPAFFILEGLVICFYQILLIFMALLKKYTSSNYKIHDLSKIIKQMHEVQKICFFHVFLRSVSLKKSDIILLIFLLLILLGCQVLCNLKWYMYCNTDEK